MQFHSFKSYGPMPEERGTIRNSHLAFQLCRKASLAGLGSRPEVLRLANLCCLLLMALYSRLESVDLVHPPSGSLILAGEVQEAGADNPRRHSPGLPSLRL